MADTDYAIQLEDVTKQFTIGDFTYVALRGVDLTAKRGELLMIVGPSGSGKTTLLSIIAGTMRSDSGKVVVNGTTLNDLNEDQLADFRRANIGFVFQQFHLLKSLNVMENVAVPLLLQGIKNEEALPLAAQMIQQVGLKGKENARTFFLSGGQQQRVAIARALIHAPPLLICDEPTASLDAESGATVMNIIKKMAKTSDRCVVIVTHDNRIYKFADRVVRMEDGILMKQEIGIL